MVGPFSGLSSLGFLKGHRLMLSASDGIVFFKQRVVSELKSFLSWGLLWGALDGLHAVPAKAPVTEGESFPLNMRWGRGGSFRNLLYDVHQKEIILRIRCLTSLVFAECLVQDLLLCYQGFSSFNQNLLWDSPPPCRETMWSCPSFRC